MSWLKKLVKGVGNVVKDSVRIGIAPIASSVNSVTNTNTINMNSKALKYQTGVGAVVGGTVSVGTDSVHKALGGFANAISGGYVDKALNLVRSDKAKTTVAGNYQDQVQFKSGILSTFEKVSKKGGGLIGSIYGGKVAAGKSESAVAGEAKASASSVVKIENSTVKSVGNGLKSTEKDMSLFGSLSTGAVAVTNAAQTPLGTSLTNILGSVVANKLAPKTNANQNVAASNAAFTTPSPNNLSETNMSAAALAAFGNTLSDKFLKVSTNGGSVQTGTWYDNNKVWIVPVSVVLGGVVAIITLIKLIFSKRRR